MMVEGDGVCGICVAAVVEKINKIRKLMNLLNYYRAALQKIKEICIEEMLLCPLLLTNLLLSFTKIAKMRKRVDALLQWICKDLLLGVLGRDLLQEHLIVPMASKSTRGI